MKNYDQKNLKKLHDDLTEIVVQEMLSDNSVFVGNTSEEISSFRSRAMEMYRNDPIMGNKVRKLVARIIHRMMEESFFQLSTNK